MGRQIIKQPNGGYAVWSTVVDDFVMVDAEPFEIIDMMVKESRRDITRRVNEVVAALERGDRPYYQFTMDFDECMSRIKEIHGGDG